MMTTRKLSEAVPLSLAMPIVRGNKERPYDDIFNMLSKYCRKNKDRLYFPLIGKGKAKEFVHFAVMRNVFSAIREFLPENNRILIYCGFPAPEQICDADDCKDTDENRELYVRGLVSVKGRLIRVGKIMNKAEKYYRSLVNLSHNETTHSEMRARSAEFFKIDLKNLSNNLLRDFLEVKKSFETDPIRDLSRSADSFMVVISRHPYDIAGMSTGRGWSSCTSLIDGEAKKYVATYASTKCLIAYLCRSDDPNIEHPVARKMLVRYEDENGNFVIVPHDVYGVAEPRFEKFCNKFCKIINRGKDDGLYCGIEGQQYSKIKAIKAGNKMKDAYAQDYFIYETYKLEDLPSYDTNDEMTTAAQKVCDKIARFAKKLPITIECRPMVQYGYCKGILLTDLFADKSGNGVGTVVMTKLIELSDAANMNIYTDAEGPRSYDYYVRLGFERSNSGHQLIHYVDVDISDFL